LREKGRGRKKREGRGGEEGGSVSSHSMLSLTKSEFELPGPRVPTAKDG